MCEGLKYRSSPSSVGYKYESAWTFAMPELEPLGECGTDRLSPDAHAQGISTISLVSTLKFPRFPVTRTIANA